MTPPLTPQLMQPPFFLPAFVLLVQTTLEQAGFEAYLAGGCVRDLLLGRTPDDYDIATSATPHEVMALFDVVVPTGIAFGGVTVVLPEGTVEVTAYRTEEGYADGRHPEKIKQVSSLREDVLRRDFTVNALCWRPGEQVTDYISGMEDLKEGIIRAVGCPQKRFEEDVLRVLRAVRFSAQLGFAIHPDTLAAARQSAGRLPLVSAERRQKELYKLLLSPRPQMLEVLRGCGALTSLLGREPQPDVSFSVLGQIQPKPAPRYAALAELCGLEICQWAKLLRFSNSLKAEISRAQEVYRMLTPDADRRWVKNQLAARGYAAIQDALEIAQVLRPKEAAQWKSLETVLEEVLKSKEPYRIPDLAIDGRKLEEWGIEPRLRGRLLEYLRQQVVENPGRNNQQDLKELTTVFLLQKKDQEQGRL